MSVSQIIKIAKNSASGKAGKITIRRSATRGLPGPGLTISGGSTPNTALVGVIRIDPGSVDDPTVNNN